MNKIFLFYVNWLNINDTYNLFPKSLEKRDEIKCIDVSNVDLKKIKELEKVANLIIIDHSIFAASVYSNNAVNLHIPNFKVQNFYENIWKILIESKKKKIYIASGWDLHWTSLENSYDYLSNIDAIAWIYEKNPTNFNNVPTTLRDEWMYRHNCPSVAWKNVRKKIPSRFEMSHFLSGVKKVKTKLWDLSVCGVSYAPRQIVMKKIKENPTIKLAPFNLTSNIFDRLIPNNMKRLKIKVRQKNQELLMSRSLINFVCGSGYNYPVRKFFEAAEVSSTLLCLPFNGFEDFGFIPNKNCLIVNFDDLLEQVNDLKRNPSYCEELAKKLQKDIFSLHNIDTQTNNFIKFIKHVADGDEVISEFKSGQYIFSTKVKT